MEHAVFYPGPDGAPAFRRFASLEEAVGFVEHMRNVEGVEDVSVQMLTPVPLAFRAYYRVEVPAAEVPAFEAPSLETPSLEAPVFEAPAVEAPMVPEQVAAVEPVVPQDVPEAEPAVAANGKRSLGFFAH